jgi:hypothetical protein
VFTCKTHPADHKPHFRPRNKTGEGTSNLQSAITQCFERWGGNRPGDAKVAQAAVIPYTEAAHRALIALRCAKNHRPFNSVLDEDYQAEVNMLRPGTKLPHPTTVSRDIQAIYLDMSMHVRNYFQVSFHIIIYKNMKHEFIFRHATAQSILLLMDGLHLLLHPFLELWLSGMRKVLYIVQFLSLSGGFMFPLI